MQMQRETVAVALTLQQSLLNSLLSSATQKIVIDSRLTFTIVI